ncbi:MAG: YitT family protein [Veillonellales bacterium]
MSLLINSRRRLLIRYASIGAGSLLCAVSINTFLVPHHLLSGGLAGIAMIAHYLFNWPIGLLVALMNVPLFYLAYQQFDKEFFFCALYGMLVFTLGIDLTRWLSPLQVVDDILLATIYGGVLSGIGSGLVFRVDGSSGGTDIIAMLLKKYYAFNVSYVGLEINCVLMTIAAFLFGIKPAMYTLLSMYVGATITDKVIQGFNKKKTITIISDYNEAIADAILTEIGRGITFLNGEGAYTSNKRKVIFIVVKLTQIAKIKRIVNELDTNAFMIVQDATEVLGKGFSLPG